MTPRCFVRRHLRVVFAVAGCLAGGNESAASTRSELALPPIHESVLQLPECSWSLSVAVLFVMPSFGRKTFRGYQNVVAAV